MCDAFAGFMADGIIGSRASTYAGFLRTSVVADCVVLRTIPNLRGAIYNLVRFCSIKSLTTGRFEDL